MKGKYQKGKFKEKLDGIKLTESASVWRLAELRWKKN